MRKILIFLFVSFCFFSCSKKEVKKEKELGNPFYDKAFEYRDSGRVDSAFSYFYKAKDLFAQRKDSFGVGKCLVNTAIILTDRGDYFGAQESSTEAIKYFDENNPEHRHYLGSNFNNLGLATSSLKDYKNTFYFYDIAIKYAENPVETRMYLNNKAKAYQIVKKYDEALKIYDDIIKGTSKIPREYARTLSNISFTKWLQNPEYNAETELLEALKIREREHDLWGLNSSYSHLADYYAEKQPALALDYAHKMYQVALQINSQKDKVFALKKLIRLGPSKEIKQYFFAYQELEDRAQEERNAAKNQFALIRYETEKNKADNLELQKDITDKKYQIIKQRILLFSALFILVLSAVIVSLWDKKRKQKLALEARNSIRENQLKTSKKVHDVVANGLYRMMAEIGNQEDIDKENILDKIEYMYEKSRDISYEEEPFTGHNFHLRVSELIRSFATETTKVASIGNTEVLWKKVDAKVKYEVEHILQELLVNMRKHSRATNVTIKFEYSNHKINIYYTDNGIGMSEGIQYNNGLTNTGTRINSICGEIIFDTKAEKGLKIEISFPIT